jgi:hypothetical protein
MADVNPVGPIFAAGDEIITRDGYLITYLPDLHNDELQRAGKPPVYYWLPNAVRLARKNGDQGDYKFRMLHFVGIRGEDSHVGVEGKHGGSQRPTAALAHQDRLVPAGSGAPFHVSAYGSGGGAPGRVRPGEITPRPAALVVRFASFGTPQRAAARARAKMGSGKGTEPAFEW